jgi:uncharacterized protein
MRQILSVNESPHKVAQAFAMGIFIGMSPLLGLHTILGIVLAWQLRLNKLVTLIGVYVTNPWTIVPIYTFATWFGAKILGVSNIIPPMDWAHMTCKALFNEFKHLLMPFIVGSTLIGFLSAILGYILIYRAVRHNRG